MHNKNYQSILNTYSASYIIDQLQPFITDNRKVKIHNVLAHRIQSLQLAIEAPSDLGNVMACIRSAEALGILTIHIIEAEHTAKYSTQVSQGAFQWVRVSGMTLYSLFLNQCICNISTLQALHYKLQILYQTSISIKLYAFSWEMSIAVFQNIAHHTVTNYSAFLCAV